MHAVIAADRLFTPDFLARCYRAKKNPDAIQIALTEPGLEDRLIRANIPDGTEIIVLQDDASDLFDVCSAPYAAGALRSAYEAIAFASPFRKAIDDANEVAIPPSATALHLRAGDIVYGNYRLVARYAQKAIPVELAEDIIRERQSEGGSILLFGQDRPLMGYLADRYGVMVAANLMGERDYSDTQAALFDVTVMSRCAEIISGGSGFAHLAAMIGGTRLSKISALIPEARAKDLILAQMGQDRDPRISPLQRSFSLRWILSVDSATLSNDTFLALCDVAARHDPTNPFYLWVKAGRLYALGRVNKAELLMRRVVKTSSPDTLARYFVAKNNGEALGATYLNPILAAADAGRAWASKARIMATDFT